ncbi:MAG: tRNA (adenosine(37)-N6)-threonylcarbamoyltransferase complex ATPase subunit type 1 TsaE [Desulfomonile tiedjei]|uniref:tRNA threonylcarbamoyladenosine biosynthesis protein TsaE n=1 Tax=Desulfomonile tiedjei TaxID=2358 RepID=A0A9D6V4T1_9BACT|nr:tRNA (adenosine(37)-N6)-threonylcarbamoyltransferase complex ATPase subunit type 1 TsaE [Desulfomonile tiedjei]
MRKTFEITSKSESDTFELGNAIGRILKPGDTIFMLGELGSGKTRLAKGIVSAAVGIPQEEVVSPTFTLINCFEGDFDVYHADLYRLAPNQVEGIGLEDALDQGGALIVEWADRINAFQEDTLIVHIRFGEVPDSRIINLEWQADGTWRNRLESAARALFNNWKLPDDPSVGLGTE